MKPALEARVDPILRSHPPEGRYLIGVSGGKDSVALLHLLVSRGYKRLTVCHLDHGLRGRASRADARFVERLAGDWKLAFVTARADVKAQAKAARLSIETAAREARLRFFANVARRTRRRTLFLAHHADDQVETFLFNLFRGSGPAGLAGMRPESLRRLDPPARGSLKIVRPLLGVWRAEIDEYLLAHRLPHREDASNADPAHTRNRLRGEIIPNLEAAFGRGIRPAVWRAADLLGEEEAWLATLAASGAPLERQLAVKSLLAHPPALQRRLLRGWLMAQDVPNVGYEEVERVRSLLDAADGPAKVNLPGDYHARRRAGLLFIEKPAAQKP
jgi:tRNA(Ile)-lysidine synthase